MQTKQLKWCTQNVHPSFANFPPELGVNIHILLTQNWLQESGLSLLSLWCILFWIKLGLFRENLNLKKYLQPKYGWSLPSTFWHRLIYIYIWVVLRNCVPLGVGNFKLVFEGNLLLQCKYFYFLSLYVDVSDNKNSNDCQSCVLCTLNRTDVAKWIKNGATDLWHRQHHWKECIRNFIKTTQWQRI